MEVREDDENLKKSEQRMKCEKYFIMVENAHYMSGNAY